MKYLGPVITWLGILWLAGAGLSSWATSPPELLGLPMGQVLFGIAVVIGLGQVVSFVASRQAANGTSLRSPINDEPAR
jgi:hypothetical protein